MGFEVVFDGVCEYFGAAFAVGTGVLLGANDDGFGAIAFVDAIDYFVKSFHLTDLLGGELNSSLIYDTTMSPCAGSRLLSITAISPGLMPRPVIESPSTTA